MGKRLVEEKIQLNQHTTGMVKTNTVVGYLQDLIAYTVPDNSEVIFNPTDFVAMYLIDNGTTPTEAVATTRVQVVTTDPMGRRERVFAEGEYTVFKSFQDVTLKYFVAQRVAIAANFLVKIKVNVPSVSSGGTGIAAANCRYALSCTLVYETLD